MSTNKKRKSLIATYSAGQMEVIKRILARSKPVDLSPPDEGPPA